MMSEDHPRTPDSQAVARSRRLLKEPPWLHAEVGRRMAERLEWIKRQPQAWCDWIAATDGAADEVKRRYPKAACIDILPPPDLLALPAPTRSEPSSWLSRWWPRATPRALEPGQVEAASVDLVWSNMDLHFAPNAPETMRAWHRALRPDGFVMFSCFGPDTLRELRAIYRANRWGEVTVEFADMHDLGDMLVSVGFADPVMDMEHLTLSWPSAEAMLAELRALGSNMSPSRFSGLRTPRWRTRLAHELEAAADASGAFTQTFEVIYGHAFKVGSGVPVAGEASIRLEDMRALLRRR